MPQFSLRQTLGIWAAAALPMAFLGWIANPALAPMVDRATGIHGSTRLLLLTAGLIWQGVLVLLLIRREAPNAGWREVRERLWLTAPRHPRTGEPDAWLWLWVVVFIALFVLSVFRVAPWIDARWLTVFPQLAEPPEFSLAQLLEPSARASLVGAWWFYALFLVLALFNTVLGEELLFRGLLLPRMRETFGRWDWVANGVLFGLYHLHQPWGLLSNVLDGVILFALPTVLFRSAWMGIIVHSAQSVYFALVLLPVFLGSA